MFVEGGVPLDVPVESLAVTSPVASQKALEGGKVPPLFIMEQGGIRYGNVPLPLRKRELKTIFPESEKISIMVQHIIIIHKKCKKLSLKERFSLHFNAVLA